MFSEDNCCISFSYKKIEIFFIPKCFIFRGKSAKSFGGKLFHDFLFIKKLLFYFHRFVFFNALSGD